MYIPYTKAKPFTIPGGTAGVLYPSSPSGNQTIAAVTMNGVYPQKGYSLNDVSTETICVTDGNYTIEAGNKTYSLNKGDIFMVFPGTKYRLSGRGASLVFITPAWEKNKNQIVSE